VNTFAGFLRRLSLLARAILKVVLAVVAPLAGFLRRLLAGFLRRLSVLARPILKVMLVVVTPLAGFLRRLLAGLLRRLSVVERAILRVVLVVLTPLANFRRHHPVLARGILTVVFVAVSLFATYFFDPITNYNLAAGAAMSIVIVGLSFLTGFSGQVSLGNGAFMGVGCYVAAIWANHHATTPMIGVLALATAAGGAVGLLIGLPATRLRGPYLAGMTIAFAVAFPSVLDLFSSWTNGGTALQLPQLLSPPGWIVSLFSKSTGSLTPNNMWLADVAIIVAGVAFFFMANLFQSRTGRAMRLVRENEVAAELAGVSLARARVLAFMVAAAYAGLGGGLTTLVSGSVAPSNFQLNLSITILAVLVIGGIGTLSGALIGGMVYAYSTTWINQIVSHTNLDPTGSVATSLNGIIFGALLIIVMLVAPLGIAGSLRLFIAKGLARRS